MSEASPLQREPFRLFFPLGLLLSWAGVGHWLLHALGVLADFKPIFHAMAQIQGFLICFAIGFLFTMVPRRTQTPPPAKWQLLVGALAPLANVVLAWFGYYAVAQLAWLVTGATILGFLLNRLRPARAQRAPPNSFVWLPIAFLLGLSGAGLAGLGAARDAWWLHQLGQALVLQGMFLALVLGVGGLAIPLMTRGEKAADATASSRDRWARAGHALAALVLLFSFLLEALGRPQSGYVLRGAVVLLVLVFSAEILRPPTLPGWIRWLIWLGIWMVPLGFFLAAGLELHPRAGLHLTFIGGFATLTMAVSALVTLGHGGYGRDLNGRPWMVPVLGGCFLVALVARVIMDLDRDRYFAWLGVAAAAFLLGTGAWSLFLLPKLRAPSA